MNAVVTKSTWYSSSIGEQYSPFGCCFIGRQFTWTSSVHGSS
jgi:hypothetical protein